MTTTKPTVASGLESLLLWSSLVMLYLYIQKSHEVDERKNEQQQIEQISSSHRVRTSSSSQRHVRILYGSTTGTSKKLATTLEHHLKKKCQNNVVIDLMDMKDYNDDELVKEDIVLFILSTWEGGKPPPSCAILLNTIDDIAHDFRFNLDHWGQLTYAIFGLGTSVYGDNYGKAAKDLDGNLAEKGAQRLQEIALGDDSKNLDQAFYRWSSAIVKYISEESADSSTEKTSHKVVKGLLKKGSNKKHHHNVSVDKEVDNAPLEKEEEDLINDSFVEMGCGDGDTMDLEDLARPNDRREMVTKLQRQALIKEGYRIIGSHSAVKLCRWTKNQLRGRGGCYKHSFYGITSYQCMEATPSLACANKCVFCWRHHKNPVGTEWRWKEDAPDAIVQQAIAYHVEMIHGMKGVPGVQPERLLEAHTVRHCALSLVGEPIMYPRINEMLRELHNRDISSFMVTNAQFPDRIDQLDPVTQLYVSIDAATKDSLQAIDRPLFRDFWDRYMQSLRALKKKAQRTVYRMTLVKSWNMEEIDNYAELVEVGMPDFIEIKAVTYCGKSDASTLTMENVPRHQEVCQYATILCEHLAARGNCSQANYAIATEHEHSCCILIARQDKFKVDGEWQTWINYDKFHALMREYYASNGSKTFRSEDYTAPTPSWAVYQSKERGFDPVDIRWRRGDNKNPVDPALVAEENESGCG